MKAIKFYLLLIFFIIFQLSLHSNNFSLSGKQLSDKDAIIKNESNTIEITGKKLNFINYTITKKIRIKILSAAGIEKFSEFTLPEVFDPSYISHFPPDRNYTFVLSNFKCSYFRATITAKNRENKDAVIKHSIQPVRMVMIENNLYGNFEKHNYKIENLEIGDELNIEYNYYVPYAENFELLSSFRIFFNNEILKENYQLTLSHNSELNINVDYFNNARPDSIDTLNNLKVYYWNKKNLPGCINENGGRPYISLPHIIFTIKPSELLYTLPYSFEEKYLPFYAIYSYKREKYHLDIMNSILQGVNTKQFNRIAEFVKTETGGIINDSLGNLSLMKIHNKIAGDFKFENDIDYFKRIDTYDPKMGDDLDKSVLRDICRYDIYVALIMKLELNYYTTYVCDNRMGVINNVYFAPMYDSDYLFTVIMKNNLAQFLYPKKSRFGYFLNEIPFYFENTNARLVNLVDYRNYRTPINDSLRQIKLPYNNINNNVRKSNILVKINLDSLSADFKAKINLSGQYSTMTRGLYQYNYKDETVNGFYNKKISDLNNKVKVKSQNINIIKYEAPFPVSINTQYHADNLLKKNGDTISLNLNQWFNHIIYNDFDISNRQLDFYPDFLGKDNYVYFIQFDKNIKLLSSTDSIEIKNDFGELTIIIEQVNPDAIKISSYFATTNNKITVNKIMAVKEIYDKIQKLNNSYLKFKII